MEQASAPKVTTAVNLRSRAIKFVVLVGIMSFFADFTYEGARGIVGPYLGDLGASAATIAIVTGFGELLGYGLRLVSGRLSDRTRQFWPITIFGYVIQMAAVPLLALAGSWQIAAYLIIQERVGKAMRNPPRDVMLSHAGKEVGYGWAFGVHEALDQSGALFGPLAVAAVLAWHGEYQIAFAALGISAVIMLSLLMVARLVYPRPEEMDSTPPDVQTKGLPQVFWIYLAGAVLVGAGFADFPFMAYHIEGTSAVPATWVPVFYAIAMGVSGSGSLGSFNHLKGQFEYGDYSKGDVWVAGDSGGAAYAIIHNEAVLVGCAWSANYAMPVANYERQVNAAMAALCRHNHQPVESLTLYDLSGFRDY